MGLIKDLLTAIQLAIVETFMFILRFLNLKTNFDSVVSFS